MKQPCSPRIFWLIVLFIAAFSGPSEAQSTENPLQLRPDHATASVADIDRAVRWYQDMLGFKVVNRGERPNGGRFADLAIPGYGIGLVQNTAASPPPGSSARSGWIHIVFAVPDPARAFATLKLRNADVTTRGNPAPAKITTFLLHDSEGNEIEIVQEH
jgi:catechol 2,3-dioxygenase-like lactoylglutathione lyase family enzyme